VSDDPGSYIAKRIVRVGPPLPGLKLSEILVASEDGSEQYVFTYGGRHLRTLDALTGVTKYTFNYDTQNRLISIVDIDSLVTQIQRDSTGKATAIISPYGVRTQLVLDANGYLLQAINPANESRQFTYTDKGLMTSMTDARGSTYTYTYDSLGYLTKDLDPVGGFTAITRAYDSTGYTVTATTAMGKVTKYRADQLRDGSKTFTTTDPNGLKTITTDATNGTATSTAPSGMQAPTEEKPDPRYGMQSPLANLTVKTPAGLQSNVNQFRKVTQMSGTQVTGLTDSVLVNGRVFKTQWYGNQRMRARISPEVRTTFTFFDTKGKVIKDSTSGLAAVIYLYDARGRKIKSNQGGRKTTFEYDSLGRQAKVTDPYGRSARFYYDGAGRLIRTVAQDSSEVLFAYDRNNNLTAITPSGKPEHTFDYSAVDLETTYTPPFAGDSSRSTSRIYTLDREVCQILRPDRLNMTFFYGGDNSLAGQPKRISYDRGTMTFLYDTTKGSMVGIILPGGDSLLYSYDSQLLKKARWTGPVKGDIAFAYNSDMQVMTERLNSTDSVNFLYDKDGLLKAAGVMKLLYATNNNLLLADTVGNVVTDYGYNTFGELVSQTSRINSTVLYQVSFSSDSLGRIEQKTETTQIGTNRFNYTYDASGRLFNVARNDTVISIYTYDPSGNRLTHTTPTKADSGLYDAQDRLLSYGGVQFVYSNYGDLIAKITPNSEGIADTTHYIYDAFGNLLNVRAADGTTIEYAVDGQNRRVAKIANGTFTKRWLYSDDLRIVAELDSANQIVSRFVYATRRNVPEYMIRRGVTYRLSKDHIGSVRYVVDAQTGAIAQQLDYDEFGNVLLDSNPGFQPFAYAGGLFDVQTKLVRFGARDYDASVGRWTSKDPILFRSGSSNHYAYASNNPVNFTDADGTAEFNVAQSMGIVACFAALTDYLATLVEISAGGKMNVSQVASLYLDTWGMFAGAANVTVYAERAGAPRLATDPFTGLAENLGLPKIGLNLTEALAYGVGIGLLAHVDNKVKAIVLALDYTLAAYAIGKFFWEGERDLGRGGQ
jgi:RHS repeat-associated protein